MLEQIIIDVLKPPTQSFSSDICRDKHQRTRPFPRFRNRVSITRELHLNVVTQLRYSPSLQSKLGAFVWNWDFLCKALWTRDGITPKRILDRSYRYGGEATLAIFLSKKGSYLDYARVWRKKTSYRVPPQSMVDVQMPSLNCTTFCRNENQKILWHSKTFTQSRHGHQSTSELQC